jgi:hypothetical protein
MCAFCSSRNEISAEVMVMLEDVRYAGLDDGVDYSWIYRLTTKEHQH